MDWRLCQVPHPAEAVSPIVDVIRRLASLRRAPPSRLRIAAATAARKIVGADSWVVGYPKCGNTWFGVMLRKALTLAYGLDETAIGRVLSDWRFSRLLTGAPAIGTTHQMPLFNVESYRDMKVDLSLFNARKVVLLIREPKDTLVSLYMHNAFYEATPLYEGDLDSMVYNDVFGIEKFIKYYVAWHEHRSAPGALMIVRYEDLSADTSGVMADALTFLGLPRVSRPLVDEVVSYGRFENMRKLEATNALQIPALAPSIHPREEAFHVRKGLVGDYINHLKAETIRHIDHRVAADLPDAYGYLRP
jgi:hypothetical protein